jgi:hypothetical protein
MSYTNSRGLTETFNVRARSFLYRNYVAARVIATTQGIKGGPADNMADFTIADCNNRCCSLQQLPSQRLYAADTCG